MSRVLIILFVLLAAMASGAMASAKLDPTSKDILWEDLDATYFTALVVAKNQTFQEAQALKLKKYTAFDFAGIVFTRAIAHDILSWQDRAEIKSIDVIDENAANTFFRVVTHLQTLARYDDIGLFRPNVINISMGPLRALVGKNVSGEYAMQAAISAIVGDHKIPIVMSAGNDGPEADTVNPWSLGTDAFVVGATDAKGEVLYDRSSRFGSFPSDDRPHFLVADGIDTLGPRAGCRPKTQEEQDEDTKGNLTARVGAGKEACWELKSGTSFSAANITKALCLIHQSLSALRLASDPATTPAPMTLPIFVRAYIDFDFDRNLEVFKNRLVDTRSHFGALAVAYPTEFRQTYGNLLLQDPLDLQLRYEPDTVLVMLKAFAKPVPGHRREETGFGFVSFSNVATALRLARLSDLIEIFTGRDPRSAKWIQDAKQAGDPMAFPPQVIDPIVSYCSNYDLILGLPVSDQ